MALRIIQVILIMSFFVSARAQWSPMGDKIKTYWSGKVDSKNPLPQYPRPIMERRDWMNLNGLWDFTISNYGQTKPTSYNEKILVPFPVESSLSGIMRTVQDKEELWYQTQFVIPDEWKDQTVLLHFGAVDWKADVWLNDIKIGTHTGGYTPFSFDISPFLEQESQTLIVKVWDPTSNGPQPRGKQVNDPKGIWYTPVSGIWQTVWLEPVPKSHINNLKITPNIDLKNVKITASVEGSKYGDILEVEAFDNGQSVGLERGALGQNLELSVEKPKLWSPESPFLYDIKVRLVRDKKVLDEVDSYFAMRKISTARDRNGILRMQLNNADYFHFGTLDQGWWPDGLYTAPTDDALKYDIEKTKEYGFNTIRKHVKVEPQRWYAHCDSIGVLVWQDMPNGDRTKDWQRKSMFDGNELTRSVESEKIYRQEWREIMDFLHSHPSIVVWVPFNEAWGMY